jgi:hypothetical protein
MITDPRLEFFVMGLKPIFEKHFKYPATVVPLRAPKGMTTPFTRFVIAVAKEMNDQAGDGPDLNTALVSAIGRQHALPLEEEE